MPMLELSDQQVVDLVKQLPPQRKRTALLALAEETTARRNERMQLVESQIRQACADRGRDWDAMPEVEREAFLDDLIHEDRPCAS